MRDFKKLTVWQKADELVVQVYAVTVCFPSTEQYGLTSQFRRAAVSIAANIAEGSARRTLKDFHHFLHIARGSLSEVEYYIHLSHRLGYLDQTQTQSLEETRREVGSILQGLISSLDDQMRSGRIDN